MYGVSYHRFILALASKTLCINASAQKLILHACIYCWIVKGSYADEEAALPSSRNRPECSGPTVGIVTYPANHNLSLNNSQNSQNPLSPALLYQPRHDQQSSRYSVPYQPNHGVYPANHNLSFNNSQNSQNPLSPALLYQPRHDQQSSRYSVPYQPNHGVYTVRHPATTSVRVMMKKLHFALVHLPHMEYMGQR